MRAREARCRRLYLRLILVDCQHPRAILGLDGIYTLCSLMARRDWDKSRIRQQVRAATRAAVDAQSYTRELFESRRAEDHARHGARAQAPQPSKAQMREEAIAAADAWRIKHPAPPPWGPWSPWRTVTRPDGTSYQERERQRLPRL